MRITEYISKTVSVKIDRPLGSKHPKHSFEYPVNYGFVPDTVSGDGEEIDAYVLGVDEPVKEFEGTCLAVIHRKDDDDDKLVIVTEGVTMTNEEIMKLVHFQEQWFDSEVIR